MKNLRILSLALGLAAIAYVNVQAEDYTKVDDLKKTLSDINESNNDVIESLTSTVKDLTKNRGAAKTLKNILTAIQENVDEIKRDINSLDLSALSEDETKVLIGALGILNGTSTQIMNPVRDIQQRQLQK